MTSKLTPKKSLRVVGAQHDTMDPEHMRWMATAIRQGRYLHCPDGSHMAMYDDQERYVHGLIDFIHDVDAGRFTDKHRR